MTNDPLGDGISKRLVRCSSHDQLTTEQHPITPPHELVEQLESAVDLHEISFSQAIASAYTAGADQELEGCCQWLIKSLWSSLADDLRAVRRPKPQQPTDEELWDFQDQWFKDPDRDEIDVTEFMRAVLARWGNK